MEKQGEIVLHPVTFHVRNHQPHEFVYSSLYELGIDVIILAQVNFEVDKVVFWVRWPDCATKNNLFFVNFA